MIFSYWTILRIESRPVPWTPLIFSPAPVRLPAAWKSLILHRFSHGQPDFASQLHKYHCPHFEVLGQNLDCCFTFFHLSKVS